MGDKTLSVKVYLDLGGGRQEVRRFGLPEAVATNYKSVKDKVQAVFCLGSSDFTLSWKDADEDLILISCDEELIDAVADNVSRQNQQLLRLYVTAEKSSRPTSGNREGEVHPGVTCDGCNGPVCGFRYKCVSCPDFDLCGGCESKGLHKEHRMMRTPKPDPKGAPRFFFHEQEGPGGQFTSHFGMHSNGNNGNTFASSSSTSTGGGAGCGAGVGVGGMPGGMPGGPGAWGSWWGGRHCPRRGGGRGRGPWGGWWGGKNWWGGKHGGCWDQSQAMNCGFGQQKQQQGQQQQQSQQQQSQQQGQQQQKEDGPNPCEEQQCPWTNVGPGQCPFMAGEGQEMPSPEQVAEECKKAQKMAEQAAHQAHHFASHMATEQVANIMKGIWTAWSGQQAQEGTPHTRTFTSSSSSSSSSSGANTVREDQPEEAQEQKTPSASSPGSARDQYLRNVGEAVASMLDPLGIDVEVAVEHEGIRQRCSLGEQQVKKEDPKEAPPATGSGAKMEVQAQEPEDKTTQPVEDMEVSSPAAAAEPDQAGQDKMERSSPDVDDWTLVSQDVQEPQASGAKAKTPPPEKKVAYPDLSEVQPHPNPVIQRALELMQAMGYSNEGGWLTHLLERKEGDINQVLDLLQPVKKV